jgi:hypothetical protein
LRLCGHAGTAPSSINTRITIRIVINQNHLALILMLECEKLEGVASFFLKSRSAARDPYGKKIFSKSRIAR